MTIGVFKDGVDYESIDNEKVKIIFLLCAPENNEIHLDVLSKLSSYLLDEHFVSSILMFISVVATIFSGWDYLKNGKDLLKDV